MILTKWLQFVWLKIVTSRWTEIAWGLRFGANPWGWSRESTTLRSWTRTSLGSRIERYSGRHQSSSGGCLLSSNWQVSISFARKLVLVRVLAFSQDMVSCCSGECCTETQNIQWQDVQSQTILQWHLLTTYRNDEFSASIAISAHLKRLFPCWLLSNQTTLSFLTFHSL
jgi:hypothetical protein